MKSTKPFAVVAVAVASFGAAQAYAAPVFYEPFNYSPGDLSTESGTWSDTGSLIESPGLSYGNLAVDGNRVTMSDDTSWIDVSSELNGLLDDGDTLWFSVLINTRVGTNPDFAFVLATDPGQDRNNVPLGGGGTGMGLRVKGNNGGLNATTWSGGNPTNGSSVGVTQGETYLVVAELIFGATDTINLYLPDTDLNLGGVVATSDVSLDQTQFDTLTFMNKAAGPRDQVDEIRIGETSGDVLPVPEPTSLALLGLGGLLIARRRRG